MLKDRRMSLLENVEARSTSPYLLVLFSSVIELGPRTFHVEKSGGHTAGSQTIGIPKVLGPSYKKYENFPLVALSHNLVAVVYTT